MATQTLAARVDGLKQRVTRLEELPAHVEAVTMQISQLRDEMGAEFSAVRDEIKISADATCHTLRDEIGAVETICRALRDEIRAGDENTCCTLRDEIRAGDARVMEHARVLHEEVISRLALIQEGRGSTSRRRRR